MLDASAAGLPKVMPTPLRKIWSHGGGEGVWLGDLKGNVTCKERVQTSNVKVERGGGNEHGEGRVAAGSGGGEKRGGGGGRTWGSQSRRVNRSWAMKWKTTRGLVGGGEG